MRNGMGVLCCDVNVLLIIDSGDLGFRGELLDRCFFLFLGEIEFVLLVVRRVIFYFSFADGGFPLIFALNEN